MENKEFLQEIVNIIFENDKFDVFEVENPEKLILDKLVKNNENIKLLNKSLHGIIWTLVNAIDAKDPYTAGHCTRVADLSVLIGRKLGKNKEELQTLYFAALLHDVGKIGIPDAIINKTSKLTDEEFALIRSHPTKGADILETIYGIPDIILAAKEHHEKWDGTGYPNKLKGLDISEIGRIVAICDSYDAMASKRSYRDVLPQGVIREEIVKGKGTQFDPNFSDLLLEIIDDDKEYTLHG